MSDENNPFSTREKFPNPKDIFGFSHKSIDEIKSECLFVLDTNVLLLPFTTDTRSLSDIHKVYDELSKKDRLFVPAHVAREFLDNRPSKLSEIIENLSRKMSQSFGQLGSYPLLNDLPEFKEIEEQEIIIKGQLKEYQSRITKTINIIKSWNWNDPVSKMYQTVLTDRILDDNLITTDVIAKDLERRNKSNIPPGFKDKNKKDNSAGDLIIWHEILKLGKDKCKPVVFISSDSKPDWWHQSGGQPTYPRIELVSEFREVSNGNSFQIISLSKFLELFEASAESIEAVKTSEAAQINKPLTGIKYLSTKKDIFFASHLYQILLAVERNIDKDLVYWAFRKSESFTELIDRLCVEYNFEFLQEHESQADFDVMFKDVKEEM